MSSTQNTSSGSAIPAFSLLLNILGQMDNLDEAPPMLSQTASIYSPPHIASPSWNPRVLQSPAYSPAPYVPTDELSPFLLPPAQQVASTSFSLPPSFLQLDNHYPKTVASSSRQIPVIDLSPSPPRRTVKKPHRAANIKRRNRRLQAAMVSQFKGPTKELEEEERRQAQWFKSLASNPACFCPDISCPTHNGASIHDAILLDLAPTRFTKSQIEIMPFPYPPRRISELAPPYDEQRGTYLTSLQEIRTLRMMAEGIERAVMRDLGVDHFDETSINAAEAKVEVLDREGYPFAPIYSDKNSE